MSDFQTTQDIPTEKKWRIAVARLLEAASIADETVRERKIHYWLDTHIKKLSNAQAISKGYLERSGEADEVKEYVDRQVAFKFADLIREKNLFNKEKHEFEWARKEEHYNYQLYVVDLGGI